ncbi:BLUF domain-containing protein [Polaromonas sp.]|uniref:BLUF domain-containing protein n=1 Tax=Polaromonas sp. TaxID=1869339 RepID=UPI001856A810|nr:BLUF domain-containing protein [Polaromonas sp.]NMM06254.1 BLUF domain-containing protein [Polaromonas sp.]
MNKLIQLIYISRSTFSASKSFHGIDPSVGRILLKSRTSNQKNGLVGVLYFGDGCFFQCLEGSEESVDALYAKLLADSRHTDLKLLAKKPISTLSFEDWAMKYVPLDQQMNQLLQSHGYKTFNPYTFNTVMTQEVMNLLRSASDAQAEAGPKSAPMRRGDAPIRRARAPSAAKLSFFGQWSGGFNRLLSFFRK